MRIRVVCLICSLSTSGACGATVEEAVGETGTSESSSTNSDAADASEGADGNEGAVTSTGADDTMSEETDDWTAGDGDGDSGVDSSTDGTTDPSTDGTTDSSTDGTTDSSTDGTTDPSTDGTTDPSTDGGGMDCTESIGEEFDASVAIVSGDWVHGMSGLVPEEGNVVWPEEVPAEGAAVFELDFPCEDDWHVWVKGMDRDTNDSFFVRVDGSPNLAEVFDLNCDPGDWNNPEYIWVELNSRPGENICGLGNPWVISAGPGVVSVEFTEREAGAISAIAFSNDPGYVPNF